MQLAVTVASLAANLRSNAEIDLYLLQDAVPVEAQRSLEASWRTLPIRAHWITPDKGLLENRVQLGGYAGVPATYFRILAADLLPARLSRIIYLDIDLLVLGDLTELWLQPFDGHVVLAVQLRPSLAVSLDVCPPECQITDDTPAFNAGVLVIDLEAWRRDRLGARALALAERYRERFRSWDQDALNCALVGRWGRLPLAWNHRPEAIDVPVWRTSGYSTQPWRPRGNQRSSTSRVPPNRGSPATCTPGQRGTTPTLIGRAGQAGDRRAPARWPDSGCAW